MKKKFTVASLNLKYKTFVLHVAAFSLDLGDEVDPSKKAQISYVKADKAPIKVLSKYADLIDIFLPKLIPELPKYTVFNNHTIELVDD